MIVICKAGELLPLAMRLGAGLLTTDRRFAARGDGLVERLNKLDPRQTVVAGEGVGKQAELASTVWAGGSWADVLAARPDYGLSLLRSSGAAPSTVAQGAIWNGEQLLYPHTVSPVVGFMDGGAGASIEAGCTIKPLSKRGGGFVACLEPLKQTLDTAGYLGPVYVGSTLTVGVRLPWLAALFELLKGDLLGVVRGEPLEMVYQQAIAVRISLPPFPNAGTPEQRVYLPSEGAAKHLWLVDVSRGQAGVVDGDVGWVTARGKDMRECRRRVYRTIKGMAIQELQYRTDIK